MTPRLGLNGATLPSSDLLTGIRAAGAAGFGFYEPRIPRLLEFDEPESRNQVRELIEKAGLGWLPINALEGVFSIDESRLVETAESAFALAKRFGIRQVIVVPGSVPKPLGRTEAIATLERLKAIAAQYDVRLLYELIGFGHHAFPSLAEARQVAQGAGLPLVLDTFHIAVSQTPLREIQEMDADEIGLVHLSDAIVGDRSVIEIDDADRVLPEEGDLPLVPFLTAIARTGYQGPLSVEVFHPKYGAHDPDQVAGEAMRRAKDLATAAGMDL